MQRKIKNNLRISFPELCFVLNHKQGLQTVCAKLEFSKKLVNKWGNVTGLSIFWEFVCQQCPCTD